MHDFALQSGPPASRSSPHENALDLRILPRQRIRRGLWRMVVVLILAQSICSAIALWCIQVKGGLGSSPSAETVLATTIASKLSGQMLIKGNSFVQRVLDRSGEHADVSRVQILDGRGQVVLESQASESAPQRTSWVSSLLDRLTPIRRISQDVEPALGEERTLVLFVKESATSRVLKDGLGAVLIGTAGGALLMSVPLHRRFARLAGGLRQLHIGIRRLTLDVPMKPLCVRGDDETAYLSLAFNEMASKLTSSRKALVEANRDLEDRVEDRTQKLKAANSLLEHQNRSLADLTDTALRFTDDVAHEFRTPLSVIMEFASITADGLGGAVSDKQAEYLRFIEDASKDLAHLVDDFLDTEKLRAGSLRVDRKTNDVEDILSAVWPMIETRAHRAGVSLKRQVDTVPSIFADGEKVGRAIVNLATNAIKFSGRGTTVTVGVRRCDVGAEVYVTDQGRGMTSDQIASLFARFKQTSEGLRSTSKGFGLGLTIVRDLVTMNLGEIHIHSTLGEGSTFSFTVPSSSQSDIVECFLARMNERLPGAEIGALRVVSTAEKSPLSVEMLACVCAPTQVVVPQERNGSWVIIGEAAGLKLLASRIVSEFKEAGEDSGSAIHTVELGRWPSEQAQGPLVEATSGKSTKEVCHADSTSH